MKHQPLLAAFLICVLIAPTTLVAPIVGQQSRTTPTPQNAPPKPPVSQQNQTPPPEDPDDEVVQITTNLVQVDAVVTDRDGRPVADLTAEDFEILEDSQQQPITNFSYVTLAPEPVQPEASSASTKTLTPPPARLRPQQVRRTIALVVDDLGMSFSSTFFVRDSLKKFVREQVQPNDLVAIIRTSVGSGALQQFTTDKRQLYAAIERLRWTPNGRGGISAFDPVRRDPFDPNEKLIPNSAGGNRDPRIAAETSAQNAQAQREIEETREEIFTVGSLGAMSFVVRGLEELPGRKSVVLISDGIRVTNRGVISSRVADAMRRLVDSANRASVVIYTLQSQGLVTYGFTAQDDTTGLGLEALDAVQGSRQRRALDASAGLDYLASETGGLFMRNTNNYNAALRRVLNDQKGYYLIGYKPDAATFSAAGARKFVNLTVRVKRPGLRVRTRNGFYNVPNERLHTKPTTRLEQLRLAINSPFSSGELPVRLTSLFADYAEGGSFVQCCTWMPAA